MNWRENSPRLHCPPWPRMWWCRTHAGRTTAPTTTFTPTSSAAPRAACGENIQKILLYGWFSCFRHGTACPTCFHPELNERLNDVFRNLSCGQQKERKAMRECSGLIDSLMSYIQSCVAEDNPDDKVQLRTTSLIDINITHPPLICKWKQLVTLS